MLQAVEAPADNSPGSRTGEEGEVPRIRCVVVVLRSVRMTSENCSGAGGVVMVVVVRIQGRSSLRAELNL